MKKLAMKPRFVLSLVALSYTLMFLSAPRAQAHPPGAHADQPKTARGIVFNDLNGNRTHDADEPGLANIKVSNGREIVRTDDQGHYALPVSEETIVFVIKPRGWMTPLNRNNLPQFYYIHKPAGSPENFKYKGVAPTGPLPESINFPLVRHEEPDAFKALMFGDPQPRNIREVEYIAHDVIEQVIEEHGHGASFGVTLGDIVFDDLSVMEPLNQAIALIGIPWYNVIGNHDMNLEAADDAHSDETFERIYGPAYYSFDHGPAHFLVLDDVTWVGAHDGQKAHYHGGLGERQLEFIRRDLSMIPAEQLVVLMMHIPLTQVDDRQQLYRLIEKRPATVSISAHTHYMEHRFIGKEDGWQGPERHHHIVNVTVCGSWWRGQPDERGIPHATMSDGGPNGYSIMEFDGDTYSLKFRAAGRPAGYQMNIYAPESVPASALATTVVTANVFGASEKTQCAMRVGSDSVWKPMERVTLRDPAYLAEQAREAGLVNRSWAELPGAHPTPHMYRAMLPPRLPLGSHRIEIRSRDVDGTEHVNHRILRVEAAR